MADSEKKISRVNLTFLITVITALTASFIFQFIPIVRSSMLVNVLLSQAIYVIPVAIYLFMGTENIGKLLRIKRIRPASALLLLVFSFFISPLLVFLNACSLLFTTNDTTQAITGMTQDYPFIVCLFVIAVVPAILEESVYRGVFFNEYRKIDARWGIVLSGLLFGLMHMNFNQFVYAFAMGMIFALVVEATGSIASSMIVHFAINGSSVFLSWILPKLQNVAMEVTKGSPELAKMMENTVFSKEILMPVIIFYGITAIFTTAIAAAILTGINQIQKQPNVWKHIFSKKEEKEGRRMITAPLVVGMMACFFLMIYQQLS